MTVLIPGVWVVVVHRPVVAERTQEAVAGRTLRLCANGDDGVAGDAAVARRQLYYAVAEAAAY